MTTKNESSAAVHQRGYKTEIFPTLEQSSRLWQHCDATKEVYNWGLAQRRAAYANGEKSKNNKAQDKILRNEVMKDQAPWLDNIGSQCRQAALGNLQKSYVNFFRRIKEGKKGRAAGYPRAHKAHGRASFRTYGFRVSREAIKIPNIGWVEVARGDQGYIPPDGTPDKRAVSLTISHRAGRWFASVLIEEPLPDVMAPASIPRMGVHLGIRVLATSTDGTQTPNPRALKEQDKRIKKLQRQLARQKKGSRNREQTKAKIAKCHARAADVRRHNAHHVSHVATRKANVLFVQKWNVAAMMGESKKQSGAKKIRARAIARGFGDAGLSEVTRQIEYKAQTRGRSFVLVPNHFPSSRRCHVCGCVAAILPLSRLTWECQECGAVHDREKNAAQNLLAAPNLI